MCVFICHLKSYGNEQIVNNEAIIFSILFVSESLGFHFFPTYVSNLCEVDSSKIVLGEKLSRFLLKFGKYSKFDIVKLGLTL